MQVLRLSRDESVARLEHPDSRKQKDFRSLLFTLSSKLYFILFSSKVEIIFKRLRTFRISALSTQLYLFLHAFWFCFLIFLLTTFTPSFLRSWTKLSTSFSRTRPICWAMRLPFQGEIALRLLSQTRPASCSHGRSLQMLRVPPHQLPPLPRWRGERILHAKITEEVWSRLSSNTNIYLTLFSNSLLPLPVDVSDRCLLIPLASDFSPLF